MDGQEKALFLEAWRHTKQDLDLRACNQDCNGMAQAKCALFIWQSISRNFMISSKILLVGLLKIRNWPQSCKAVQTTLFSSVISRLTKSDFTQRIFARSICFVRFVRCAVGQNIFRSINNGLMWFTGKSQFTRFHGYADCQRRRKPFGAVHAFA